MGIKAERQFRGKTIKGEHRQTRHGVRFFSDKTLKGKGDFSHGFEINPSPIRMAKAVGGLPKRFDDLKELWPKIHPIMKAMLRSTLASGSGPNGETWAQPNPAYTKRKKHEGHGNTPVVRIGTLKAKLGEVVTKTKVKLSVGLKKLPYARAVNFGFRGPGNQKQVGSRMFMGWTKAGMSKINAALVKYQKQAIADVINSIRSKPRGAT